ncbi:hypothetical protein [Sphingobacterium siyangense]|uniref:Lipopolysaccharide biosynthesis protein n=1 Tax=Sphingobacterium siyangense TaxID=459529 RepID=A0A562MAR8_9SPHI|nr:hypothetical protein [Sphingobacterium siyangense]TWI16993.1 hypothetical protein IQ31_03972 [Sphingobacterium siyangense]
MNKKILLLVPNDYQLYKLVQKNIEDIGFDVTVILHNSVKFKYKSIFQRLYKLFRKLSDGNNSYKQELIIKYSSEQLINRIEAFDMFDYCLVFRADFFHIDVLNAAKRKSKWITSYHYDGLKRNPSIFERISIFDKFYVFDKEDVMKTDVVRTYLSHNFYFDFDQGHKEAIHDAYFLGYYSESREYFLLSLFHILNRIYSRVKFQIVFPPEQLKHVKKYTEYGVECLKRVVPFGDYLDRVERSNIIVDFLIGDHNGLSFRIFEGLKYSKKVITTNPNVVKYDFYHPNNFYVLNESSLDEKQLLDFLDLPYVKIADNIRQQYSFTSWFNQMIAM